MAFKFTLIVACAVFATANAGLTLTSGSDNTYRSLGNLAQVSTQSKTIDTPYSSSSKTDVRVSNPSVYVSAQPALSYSAHSAPVYASPEPALYENHHAKLTYAAVPQATVNYASAPVTHTEAYYPQQASYQSYPAPSVYPATQQIYSAAPSAVPTKRLYAAPATYQVAEHAPVEYAAPATYSHPAPATYSHAAPAYASYANDAPVAAAHQPVVKVTYSPANEVSHLSYTNVNDHISYGW